MHQCVVYVLICVCVCACRVEDVQRAVACFSGHDPPANIYVASVCCASACLDIFSVCGCFGNIVFFFFCLFVCLFLNCSKFAKQKTISEVPEGKRCAWQKDSSETKKMKDRVDITVMAEDTAPTSCSPLMMVMKMMVKIMHSRLVH